jgi:pyruvate dehydrogenase E2 component (dihydrolipoamide acetyltransferase)
MTHGNLAKWLKKEGDKIQPGDLIASIETDKATVDWEATEAGYLAKILIPEGSKDVTVGKPAVVTVEEEEDVAKFKDFSPEGGAAPAPKKEEAPAAPKAAPAPEQPKAQAAPSTPAPAPKAAPQAAPAGGRVFASPLARKVAQEQGVDVAAVPGTGSNNRVIRADVLEYAAKGPASVFAATSAPTPAPGGQYTDIPNTQIRKVIAARLTESKQTVPHYYLSIECRVDKLLRIRQELNAKGEGAYKLSVNDFIIKAAALALQKKPTCNSAWFGDYIRQYNNVDINVAVSTDEGLFTPIVQDADKKGLATIANTVKDLATRAKEKKLQPQEFQGGTFTISNLGMFGVKQFAAVINPPQSCILAVGGTEKKVVPNEDKETLAAQPYATAHVMNFTLSCDHRVVDGAVGAEWLKTFKDLVEDPVKMLL